MAGTEWQFDRQTSIRMDNLGKHNNDYEFGIESHTSTAQKSCPKTHVNAQTTHRMLHLPSPLAFRMANREEYRSSVPHERLHIGGQYPGFFRDAHSTDGLDGHPKNRRWLLVREVHRALVAPNNYSASNWCLLGISGDFDRTYPSLYELHRRPPQRYHSCISTPSKPYAMCLLFCARLSFQTWYQIKQSKITRSQFSTSEVSN